MKRDLIPLVVGFMCSVIGMLTMLILMEVCK